MKDLAAASALIGLARQQARQRTAKWSGRFVLATGGLFAWLGANHLLDAFGPSQVWGLPDPLLGISFRVLLPLIGLAELSVTWLCLFSRRPSLGVALTGWLAVDYLIYRVGLWMQGWPHPWILVGGLANTLNVSPLVADVPLILLTLFLLAGSTVVLWVNWGNEAMLSSAARNRGWPRERRAAGEERAKMICPACGGHIEFPVASAGQKITCPHCQAPVTPRKAEETMKTSCYFCKGHIEFPAHAIGQKLKCPHCRKEITLKEQA